MCSDILGELDLPRSGITTYDHLYSDNGLPKGVTLEYWPILQQKDVMISYSAQLQLRVLLNRIHWALYNVEQAGWSTKACAELDYQLAAWRGGLPEDYRWSDTDPPSPDINAACMRAKYYGASYLIHRPFLHDALHPIQPNGTSNPAVQQRSFPPASVKPVEVTPEVYEASKKCVEAAIQSTIAFDGVHKRPIVTNIFGTAHAYVSWFSLV